MLLSQVLDGCKFWIDERFLCFLEFHSAVVSDGGILRITGVAPGLLQFNDEGSVREPKNQGGTAFPRAFLDDQRAQVLAVEHHDIGAAGRRVVVDEQADQDTEGEAQVVGQDGRGGHLLVGTLGRIGL